MFNAVAVHGKVQMGEQMGEQILEQIGLADRRAAGGAERGELGVAA